MTTIEIQFIQNMVKLRKAHRFTQEEFASSLGVKRTRLGAWEERRAFPNLDYMIGICEIFGVELSDMINGVVEPKIKKESKQRKLERLLKEVHLLVTT